MPKCFNPNLSSHEGELPRTRNKKSCQKKRLASIRVVFSSSNCVLPGQRFPLLSAGSLLEPVSQHLSKGGIAPTGSISRNRSSSPAYNPVQLIGKPPRWFGNADINVLMSFTYRTVFLSSVVERWSRINLKLTRGREFNPLRRQKFTVFFC